METLCVMEQEVGRELNLSKLKSYLYVKLSHGTNIGYIYISVCVWGGSQNPHIVWKHERDTPKFNVVVQNKQCNSE
ncbi:hypothetical protein ANN_24052 [Periplaneta americana]|uniref:Uncharacterized protein n=1 Tax=Periplaneta americana TaxID=6978 RepID=A0ABQ8S216_PERAM|nr:hypothetical protein ANN_24052 [Periplaneta americana]